MSNDKKHFFLKLNPPRPSFTISLVIDFSGKILAGHMPKKKASIAQNFVVNNIDMIKKEAAAIIKNKHTKK
ncbi:MAG: hypothetical protein M3004_07430 [Bacteroidota bacterium]|nr:hypothetical protein [Bacteroidota bacterium]